MLHRNALRRGACDRDRAVDLTCPRPGKTAPRERSSSRSKRSLPPSRSRPFDYAQLLLTGQLDTGERVDVTRMATIDPPANLVQLSPAGSGPADRRRQRRIASCSVAGQTVTVPVKVTGQKDTPQVSFVRDVMPTLSQVGCNAGTCHGAAKGKNGFKLSLRGYDPELRPRR